MSLIMSFNPFKPLIHNIQALLISNIQKEQQRKDDEQECLQYGICAVQAQSPRPEELYFG
ncbi:hypothetical protein DNJ72_05635 [Prochlorococcus marinus XMU1403]|uniref:hypothetical protein n=1 Tax=Prochlorococcus marinus TaxID=1219 RepID=UPI000D91526A|nr:hypothetical protein [Prochlorococcus marinus]PYE01818.1 hypothetical protein DNJ72_05635 [Prochlorococcus marinus XMU1403]